MYLFNIKGAQRRKKETVFAAFRDHDNVVKFADLLYRNADSELYRSMTLGFEFEIYEDTEFTEEGIFAEGFVNEMTDQKYRNSKYYTLAAAIRALFPGLF